MILAVGGDHDQAAGPCDTTELPDGTIDVRRVIEHVHAQGRVERPRLERQRLDVARDAFRGSADPGEHARRQSRQTEDRARFVSASSCR